MTDKELETHKNEIVIKEHSLHLKVGDILIDSDGCFYKIDDITDEHIHIQHKYDGKWSSYGSIDYDKFYKNRYVKIEGATDDNYQDMLKQLVIEAATSEFDYDETENVESTDLVLKDKSFYEMQQTKMQQIQRKQMVLAASLERKRREIANVRDKFMGQLRRINKVLGQIELYLGVNEDIVQIQEGAKAPSETPISLRQKIYFMDEEVGVIDDGGLDYQNIEEFDEWLLKDERYKEFIPEEKSVIIFKPRRKDKDYYNNALMNFFANQPNKCTYILIRNGENLYRVFADIIIQNRVFPTQEEMKELFFGKDVEERFTSWEAEKKEDKVFTYRQNIILLQGLIDRTQIFTPLPIQVNLFKPDSYGDFIQFVRDDELMLPNGKEYWRDWRKRINSTIEQGSRIYFSGFNYSQGYSPNGDYPDIRIENKRLSETPPPGIYTILEIKPSGKWSSEELYCNWLPEEPIWDASRWEDRKRTKKVRFMLRRDDEWLLNYDNLSLEDLEYYLTSRVDREHYLDMFPVLKGLKKMRLEELEWEKGFVTQISGKLKCNEQIVWDAIDWWKNKVKWKRPIMSDDAKALRMIEKKIIKDMVRT
jgi:hypothetical protein